MSYLVAVRIDGNNKIYSFKTKKNALLFAHGLNGLVDSWAISEAV